MIGRNPNENMNVTKWGGGGVFDFRALSRERLERVRQIYSLAGEVARKIGR